MITEAVAQRCSVKKVFLEILLNSPENTCARVSFLIKLQAEPCSFIKKETLAQVFSCEFCEISKNTFSYRTPPVAASVITWSRFARMKFQLVQPEQISLHDYIWKLNFVLARRDSFPNGLSLDLHALSLNFSLWACQFTKLKTHKFPLILKFFAWVV